MFLLGACNRIDTELVGTIQANLNKMQEFKPNAESAKQNVTTLLDQMGKAPDGLKMSADFGFADLFSRAQSFEQKYDAMIAVEEDMRTKLETMLGDYTDGKIKKEEIMKEQEAALADLDGLQKQLEMMGPLFDQVSANYAKMMATWQSLPESAKAAASQQASKQGVPDFLLRTDGGEKGNDASTGPDGKQ